MRQTRWSAPDVNTPPLEDSDEKDEFYGLIRSLEIVPVLISEFNLAYAPHLNIVDGTLSMIEGGPWKGTPANTNLILTSGDRVGADVVGLGIIKSFGRWPMVTEKDVWEQRQIKRALELEVGNKKDNLKLIVGKGSEEFKRLMERVRGHTGISQHHPNWRRKPRRDSTGSMMFKRKLLPEVDS